jgi:hypothetical protein
MAHLLEIVSGALEPDASANLVDRTSACSVMALPA